MTYKECIQEVPKKYDVRLKMGISHATTLTVSEVNSSAKYNAHCMFMTPNVSSNNHCLLCFHGIGDHHNVFGDFGRNMNAQGYTVVAFTHPGYGKTFDGKWAGANLLLSQMFNIIVMMKNYCDGKDKKLSLIGQSMGSAMLLCLSEAIEQLGGIERILLFSPAIRPLTVNWKKRGGKIAEPEINKERHADPDRHHIKSPTAYVGPGSLTVMMNYARQHSFNSVPTKVIVGGQDKVVMKNHYEIWLGSLMDNGRMNYHLTYLPNGSHTLYRGTDINSLASSLGCFLQEEPDAEERLTREDRSYVALNRKLERLPEVHEGIKAKA